MNQKKSNALLVQILAGILVGIMLGGFFPVAGQGVAFLGDLFIRALLMLVVPLVITSMVAGITGLGDIRHLGDIGGKTVIYYTTTTALAVFVGLVLVNIIQPGYANTETERIALRGGELLTEVSYRIEENIEDNIDESLLTLEQQEFKRAYDDRYMVLLLDQDGIRGVISSIAEPRDGEAGAIAIVGQWTDKSGAPATPRASGKGIRVDLTVADRVKGKEKTVWEVLREVAVGLVPRNLFEAMVNNDVLPLIIFALVFGAVLTTMGDRGQPVIALFHGLNDAIMEIIHLLMQVSPIGIGALIAGRLGNAGGFFGFLPELLRVSKYAGTVILGLSIHGLIILPLILYFIAKRSPATYVANTSTALTTAFSTSSSSATLPVTMTCATEKNQISERTASFVLPLGATINMDGTALYEAVAAVFIAQVYGIELGFVQMLVIFLTATLAAIGAAGIPEAGLVTMVIVLRAVNLPVEGISLLLVIDWFLDRCRTTVNVWGDAVGAAVIEHLETSASQEKPIGDIVADEQQTGLTQ